MKVENVVIITDSATINGGGAKIATMTAIGLANVGLNVYMFCGNPPENNELKNAGVIVIPTYQSDILKEKHRVKAIFQGLWNHKAEKMLSDLLKNLNPDNTIIHIHVWCKVLSHSIFKPIVKYKFKGIITLHDYFTICANGGLYNYKKKCICKIKPGSIPCLLCNCDSRNYYYKIYRYIRLRIQNLVLKQKYFSAIVLSRYSKNVFVSFKALEKFENIYSIPNPIEFPKIRNNIVNPEYYLFIGRLEEDKGIRLFCDAITNLNLNGVVLGSGYLLNELKIKYKNISFKGWVSSEDVYRYAQYSKALIVGTLWHETFGLVVLEMKALGIPSIVPNNHASSDFIRNFYDGYIYETGNLEDLESKIQLLEQTDILKVRTNIIKNFDKRRYSIDVYISNLINAYEI